MAERYGLSADEVYSLMSRGRFRVKANVDQATAERYARELEALGARVQIEEVARHGRTLPPQDRAGAGTAPSARAPGGSTKSPPLTPSGESPHGLLMPLREEVRDRAADPAACGPRHRMSPTSVPSPLSALRDAALDSAGDGGEGVVRHRASWPSRPPGGAPNTPWPAHLDSRATAARAPVATPPHATPRAAHSTPSSE
ncbi:MAG TPA: hypothetical protein VGD80_44490, partial [Kofleriaceae bacterium]